MRYIVDRLSVDGADRLEADRPEPRRAAEDAAKGLRRRSMSTPSDGARFAGVLQRRRVAGGVSPSRSRFGGRRPGDAPARRARHRTLALCGRCAPACRCRPGAADVLLSLQARRRRDAVRGRARFRAAAAGAGACALDRPPALAGSEARPRRRRRCRCHRQRHVGCWICTLRRPGAGDAAASRARRWGEAVVASMAKERKACETPAGRAALDRLTQRLTAAASRQADARCAWWCSTGRSSMPSPLPAGRSS